MKDSHLRKSFHLHLHFLLTKTAVEAEVYEMHAMREQIKNEKKLWQVIFHTLKCTYMYMVGLTCILLAWHQYHDLQWCKSWTQVNDYNMVFKVISIITKNTLMAKNQQPWWIIRKHTCAQRHQRNSWNVAYSGATLQSNCLSCANIHIQY